MDVSIIIPYDRDRGFLKECIKSAEAQNFSGNYEVIVQRGNYTVGKNMNDGVMRAKGKYIKKLDEDDFLPPDSIQILYDFAEQGDYDWVWADAICFNPEGRQWVHKSRSWVTLNLLLNRNYIHGGTALYHRKTFEEQGGFDENLWTAEEYDWHLLLIQKNYERGYIPHIVYWQRIWDGSKYLNYERKKGKERVELRNIIKSRYEL